jgi:predicted nucleic-acid-binding Zn-ribbon protein
MADLTSKPCPNCTPDETLEQHEDPHGKHVPGFWRTNRSENTKTCYNCGYTEDYHPKSSRNGKEHGTTKSQEEKLEKLREHAEDHSHTDWEMETEHLDSGPMSIRLEFDPDEALTGATFHVHLSRRGKLEVNSCFPPLGGGAEDALVSMLVRDTGGHDARNKFE